MAELGDKARHYHEEVGQLAKDEGIDRLFTLGVLSQSASDVYGQQGLHCSTIESLMDALYAELHNENDDITILVKGSRSARMERVVSALEASPVGKLDRSRSRIAC